MTEQEERTESPESRDWDVEEKMAELRELAEMDFINVGEAYGIEQFLSDPEDWRSKPEDRDGLVQALGKHLGGNMIEYSESEVIRRFHDEGVGGEPSEGGAEVEVLDTNDLLFEIHVFRYANPDLGIRYNLVRRR